MFHFKYFYQRPHNGTVFVYLKDEMGNHNRLLELVDFPNGFANSTFNESTFAKARNRLIESAIDL
jgi:hypothetical protein